MGNTCIEVKEKPNIMTTSTDLKDDLDFEKEVVSPIAHSLEQAFSPKNMYVDTDFLSIVREELRVPMIEGQVDTLTEEYLQRITRKIERLLEGKNNIRISFEVSKGIRMLDEVYTKGYLCLFNFFLEPFIPPEICKEILDYVDVENRDDEEWEAFYDYLGSHEENTV